MIVFQENKDLFFLRSSLQMSMKATHTDKHSGKKKKKKIDLFFIWIYVGCILSHRSRE